MKSSLSTSTTARIWAPSGSSFRTRPVLPALGCGVPSGFVGETLTFSPIQPADSEVPMEKVETADALSDVFSPCLLTPMVASRTRKGSYPSSLMRETASEICPESERDLLMAAPSSLIRSLSRWSTWPSRSASGVCVIVMPEAGLRSEMFRGSGRQRRTTGWKVSRALKVGGNDSKHVRMS